MSVRYRQEQERRDRRAGLAAWLLANINRDTERKSEAFEFDEVVAWLGYSHTYVRPEEPDAEPGPSQPEKVLQQVEMLNQLYGGVDQRNGMKG